MTADTPNFGLMRVATGESITDNGNRFSDSDRLAIDNLLYALQNHTHAGVARLGNPSVAIVATLEEGSGFLAPDTTYYYTYSLLDQWGLETATAPEVSITTSTGLSTTIAPSLTTAAGGTLLASTTYSYVYTWESGSGGETLASDISAAVTTVTNKTVNITIPSLPSGASHANIYRTRPGLSAFYWIGSTTTTTFEDDGLPDDCCGSMPPTQSTATVSASVVLTAPTAPSATGWRVYRTTSAGVYLPTSLVAEADISEDITDGGSPLLSGMPRSVSTTIADPAFDPDVLIEVVDGMTSAQKAALRTALGV